MSTSTDHKIDKVLSSLEEYKISHPTLYRLWSEYIKLQQESMLSVLSQCENAMKHMNTLEDCNIETIQTLYNIMQIQQRQLT